MLVVSWYSGISTLIFRNTILKGDFIIEVAISVFRKGRQSYACRKQPEI